MPEEFNGVARVVFSLNKENTQTLDSLNRELYYPRKLERER